MLLVDAQGSLTASLGYRQPDQMKTTLATILGGIINDSPLPKDSGILHHGEGVDLLPANIELSEMEVTLVNTIIALGAGLAVWGVINLLEGYGNHNPGANAHVR